MSVKSLRELNPTARSNMERAKTAAQSKNYDYAITLALATVKDEPLYLEGRRFLRVVEIQKYKTTGTLTRQMANMKIPTQLMKLSSKKQPLDLLAAAEDILQADPYNQRANMAIAEAAAGIDSPETKCFALETIADGKAVDKTSIPTLHLLAKAYMECKQHEKADSTYQRILNIDNRDGEAISGQKEASAALSHEKWEGAQKSQDFRQALKDEKESEQLESQSKIVKSADAIEEQIQLNYQKHVAEPTNPNYPKAIASLYVQKNEFANAIPWYEAAFAIGGGIDSSLERTVGDLRLKAAESEIHELKEAQAQQTDPEVQAQYQAAIEQKETELNNLQLSLAEGRVKAHPNDGEFRFQLGEALYKTGQYKRATEELQQAINTQPSIRYPALNLLGLSFMKRNMLDFAISRLAEAEHELPDMTQDLKKEITYNLGLAYESAKQPEKALEQWKKIYVVQMNYRDVAARVEASYGG